MHLAEVSARVSSGKHCALLGSSPRQPSRRMLSLRSSRRQVIQPPPDRLGFVCLFLRQLGFGPLLCSLGPGRVGQRRVPLRYHAGQFDAQVGDGGVPLRHGGLSRVGRLLQPGADLLQTTDGALGVSQGLLRLLARRTRLGQIAPGERPCEAMRTTGTSPSLAKRTRGRSVAWEGAAGFMVLPFHSRVLALPGAGLVPLPSCASARHMRASASAVLLASSVPPASLGCAGASWSCIVVLHCPGGQPAQCRHAHERLHRHDYTQRRQKPQEPEAALPAIGSGIDRGEHHGKRGTPETKPGFR